ncbi:MAG TPA: alpha/beta fold hydrolase [Phenylobacterium sp.]|jgi:hypothetical protein|nr:alpha/beta fold hydrolase [Phenylobacterium sp.]
MPLKNPVVMALCAALAGALAVTPAAGAAAGAAAPWSAPASSAVIREEKTFSNAGATLSGTLYAPVSRGKVPAVVVFHGASEPSRDSELYRHLIQMLPPLGIAVLVFDRRGSGKSVGARNNGDFDMLADDGVAAARMLARDPRIDPKRIGFWGLSQGGWLSLLAAAHSPPAAFAIAVSAPLTTADVQMSFAAANILRIDGYSQADIDQAVAARTALDDFERGKLDRATAQARIDAAAKKPWFDLIYLGKTFHDPAQSDWARQMRNDPLKTLDKVKIPTLIIYGAADPWVPVAVSVKALRASAAQHPNITTAVVAGADHEMSLTTSPKDEIDPAGFAKLAPDSAEYFALLASWLTAHGLTRGPGS